MASKDKYALYNRALSKEDQNKLKILFEALDKDPQAYDFLEPVDYVGKNF